MLWYQSVPLWFSKMFPAMEWNIPGESGKDVYLTFDDGPHPDISPWVLEQLDRYQVKATFFLVGDNVRKYPETHRLILEKGHQTGNHTMHHLKGWETDTEQYLRDIASCRELVDSNLFRPPYGRIRRRQRQEVSKQYRIIMWSLLSCDFNPKLNPLKALEGLKNKTKNGTIVVFHDSLKSERNLKSMLPEYLRFLNEKGFICKTF